ncbi:MAG: hypothetical protein ACI88H_000717 [Cocleimonas sp.]|jgi:hypothetical protein
MKKVITTIGLMATLIISSSVFAATQATEDKPLPPNVPNSTKANDVNAVFVFNRVCYGQMPEIKGVVTMANELGWSPLDKEELAQLSTSSESDKVYGWDTPIGERAFRVTLVKGTIAPALIDTFPEFKNGTSTSCSLVLDGRDPGSILLEQLGKLAGKEPAKKNIFKDGLHTTTWAGGNADTKVFLIGKTDKMKQGTLINVVMLNK